MFLALIGTFTYVGLIKATPLSVFITTHLNNQAFKIY